MKVEGYVFSFYTLFLGISGIVYWYTSKDPTGTTALIISAGLGVLIGGYLLFTARRIEPRPQDLPDAEVVDGAGELGHFSPGSYWPFFIGFGLFIFMTGVVWGLWLALIGAAVTFATVVGLLFEHYVGHYAATEKG